MRAQDVPGKDAVLGGAAEQAISLSGVLKDASETTSPSEVNKPYLVEGELHSFYLTKQRTRPTTHGHGGRAGQDDAAMEIEGVDGISSPHCMPERLRGDDSKKQDGYV